MGNIQGSFNSGAAMSAMELAAKRALEVIGGKAESYAKGLAPVVTDALRTSITHQVRGTKVVIGSPIHYAPYVELGTGNKYEPPPEWIEAHAKQGRGLDHWFYMGEDGKWHVGYPRVGVKFLQHAIQDHLGEYKMIIKTELNRR